MQINIETKFNIGDTIYYLGSKKVQKAVVSSISVLTSKEKTTILYPFIKPLISIAEEECYATQEELIAAISIKEE